MDSNNKSIFNEDDDYMLRKWLVIKQIPMFRIQDLYDKIRSLPNDERKLYQEVYSIADDHEETIEKIRFILGK